jgi:uncharacterized protein (TIGR02996 family)
LRCRDIGERGSTIASVNDVGIERLVDAVLETPTDLSRRLVVGDALLERGDPRGEFIALQRRRHERPTLDMFCREAIGERERLLARRHQKAWLGPLAAVLDQPQFRFGFVSSARVRPLRRRRTLNDSASRMGLRTIERLEVAGGASDETVLSLDELISLRWVKGLPLALLEAVVERRGQLPWTHVSGLVIPRGPSPQGRPWDPETPNEGTTKAFEAVAALDARLPRLRSLDVTGARTLGELERLLVSPLAARLAQLGVSCVAGEVERVLALVADRGLPWVTLRPASVVLGEAFRPIVWDGLAGAVYGVPAETRTPRAVLRLPSLWSAGLAGGLAESVDVFDGRGCEVGGVDAGAKRFRQRAGT